MPDDSRLRKPRQSRNKARAENPAENKVQSLGANPKLDAVRANLLPVLPSDHPCWLVWRLEADGKAKPRKVPYYVNGRKRSGTQGSTKDRERLADFDTARHKYESTAADPQGFRGVGMAVLPELDVTVVDVDHCLDEHGKPLHEFAALVIAGGGYVERSPSGRGLRAIYTKAMPGLTTKRDLTLPDGNPVEVSCGTSFVTITGDLCGPAGARECGGMPEPIAAALRAAMGPQIGPKGQAEPDEPPREDEPEYDPTAPRRNLSPQYVASLLALLPNDYLDEYHSWLSVGFAVNHQFEGSIEGREIWKEWSSQSEKYDEETCDKKWPGLDKPPKGVKPFTIKTLEYRVREWWKLGAQLDFTCPDEHNPLFPKFDETLVEIVTDQWRRDAHRFNLLNAADATDPANYQPVEYLSFPYVQNRGLFPVAGFPGDGKSTVVTTVCFSLANKLPIGDSVAKEAFPAAFLCADDPDGTYERLRALALEAAAKRNADPKDFLRNIWVDPIPAELSPEKCDELADALRERGVKFLVIDTGITYTPATVQDDNSNVAMHRFASSLGARLANEMCVWMLMHPKQDAKRDAELAPRGASSLKGVVKGMIAVWSARPDPQGRITDMKEQPAPTYHRVVHMQTSTGKYRGKQFALDFQFRQDVDSGYRTRDGKPVLTTVAHALSKAELEELAKQPAPQASGQAEEDAAGAAGAAGAAAEPRGPGRPAQHDPNALAAAITGLGSASGHQSISAVATAIKWHKNTLKNYAEKYPVVGEALQGIGVKLPASEPPIVGGGKARSKKRV